MRQTPAVLAVLAILVALLAVPGNSYSQGGITITDIGTLGGPESSAVAINDLGQVTGWSYTGSGETHAFVWQDGVMTDLGTLGGSYRQAVAINELGQVVGRSSTVAGETHAFVWQDGVMTDLGTLGGDYSGALAANDLGQVVGESNTLAGEYHAFPWQRMVMSDLGTLGGFYSSAVAVNDLGQVAGHGSLPPNQGAAQHGFLWQEGVMTDLGTLGGSPSWASDVNNQGIVAGMSQATSGDYHATLWAAELRPPTPEEQIQAVAAGVTALADRGTLDRGKAMALTQALENAERALERENTTAACNLLQAFANQVQALVSAAILSQAQGQPLLDAAQSLIAELCG